jgi:hypothetical protein
MIFNAPLGFHRGPNRGRGVGEDSHECVSLGVIDASALSGDRAANDPVVVAHDLHPSGLSQASGELRRPLDVREQERHVYGLDPRPRPI